MSGGDLDGDTYFVSWDPELTNFHNDIPSSYEAFHDENPVHLTRDPIQDIGLVKEYFLDFIVNQNPVVGKASNTLMALADKYGIDHEKCKKVSNVISNALDAVGSGWKLNDASMERLFKEVSFPHYMEKSPMMSYRSESIVGKL